MASLVLGPMLRYVGDREATIWVETDAPCEVAVLGCSAPTFTVAGHHYALVHCSGLEPGTTTPYEVALDGEPAWPEADSGFPPSVVRTTGKAGPLKLMFGSCRVSAPHTEPYSLRKDEDDAGREVDALRNLAMRMRETPVEDWPHTLIMLGDQVYADEVSPKTREEIRARRDTSLPPYDTIADFEEYTILYREAWGEPYMRWLLSTVATAMIFDDHDVHDDWNTSLDWIKQMRATGWWDRRIVGGFATYWLYQHLGNLSPDELEANDLYCHIRENAADATDVLFHYAFCSDREVEGVRWSFARDIGSARLVMVDSRAGRVLEDGKRAMIDDDEFDWVAEQVTGSFEHLLVGTSLKSMPGHPKWQLAPIEMAWEGQPLGAICEQIKDPARNGGKSMAELLEHMAHDDLVGWGWNPGEGREPAPGNQEVFGALIKAWIDTGAHCP